MKDLLHYISTHPGIESQNELASARVRTAPNEGEDAYLPALWPAHLESKIAGMFDDRFPLQSADTRFTKTLDNSAAYSFVAEGSSDPGGHKFLTNATPTAHDSMQASGNRGVLISATPANGGAFTSNAFVFQTQLQVSDVSASGLGFVAGWLPAALTTHPEAATPSNGVYFQCTSGQAGLELVTVAGGGGAHALSTFNLANGANPSTGVIDISAGIDYRLTIAFGQAPGGNVWGRVYAAPYANAQMGWMTPMTSAQLVDIEAMITAADVYLSGYVGFRVASTTQRAGYVQYLAAVADR